MQETYTEFYSHHLGHNVKMLTFGTKGYPLVIFPTTLGSYSEAKDRGMVETLRWFVERGFLQVFCPDSINNYSWYAKIHPKHKVERHLQYDRFLAEEFIPQIRWNTGTGRVACCGISFGGFSAANFAFRHPEMVSHLICLSGAFSIKSFLHGYYDDNVYFNNPVDFIPNANNPYLWDMKIILGTSNWDICLDNNLKFSEILRAKQIPHWLDVLGDVEHDWPLWLEMLPRYAGHIK
ncbi:alpha/beta hydrolase-fold protein [Neolewinella antarctica]|uniref:Esterase/lipase superfamily enzyme n=1 Tax=Neolewinella antarctica TaxID=442734 RepID=A0ABX0XES4_9BACT|nr:alpha/beta hydrolase-fold protein [Neolewinella antarctica]NJC27717.1 esterase/lipase superfamily enzyme [Neolewinella antarctica]